MSTSASPRPAAGMPATANLRIRSLDPLVPPARLANLLPLDAEVIAKPFTLDALTARVRGALGAGRG